MRPAVFRHALREPGCAAGCVPHREQDFRSDLILAAGPAWARVWANHKAAFRRVRWMDRGLH